MNKRVTQRDIAAAAGVDVSTVSLALHAHPRIPEHTRERIRRLADEMGYRPDPALSSIASLRWQGKRDVKGCVIGFLADAPGNAEVEVSMQAKGIRDQAAALGYGVEHFPLGDYASPSHLWRVIQTRGIRGLLVGQSRTLLDPDVLRLASVPVVHCGYLRRIEGDVVRPDLRSAVERLLEELQRQYHRIVCYLVLDPELHSDRVILGAALTCSREAKPRQIRVIETSKVMHAKALQKMGKHKVDALVMINERQAAELRTSGRVPDTLPIFTLHTLPPFDGKQGIDLRMEDVGRIAVNFLELKMRQLPLAEAPFQQSILVAPRYVKPLRE
ncbi:MAG: LacI family DNA-binding transcriptional regulator [Kiritimatiellae bacterium]|jgi:DNA-binding LacI/PurR family transcriptional regulator|nr:LacI family DNA-binding transcriptional regulator [Kiritimatiellia bacterium]